MDGVEIDRFLSDQWRRDDRERECDRECGTWTQFHNDSLGGSAFAVHRRSAGPALLYLSYCVFSCASSVFACAFCGSSSTAFSRSFVAPCLSPFAFFACAIAW